MIEKDIKKPVQTVPVYFSHTHSNSLKSVPVFCSKTEYINPYSGEAIYRQSLSAKGWLLGIPLSNSLKFITRSKTDRRVFSYTAHSPERRLRVRRAKC